MQDLCAPCRAPAPKRLTAMAGKLGRALVLLVLLAAALITQAPLAVFLLAFALVLLVLLRLDAAYRAGR